MKKALPAVKDMVQNAIDFTFPLTSRPELHAIFTEQLLETCAQADGFIDLFLPLSKMATSGGMDAKEG